MEAIDTNAAVDRAQNDIDNYAANVAADAALPVASSSPPASPALAPLDPPAPGTPGGLADDRTPISEAPFAADSAQGAAQVVQLYYLALGEGDYAKAYKLWGDGGRASGMSAAQFAQSFASYAEYHANVGAPGAIDAGAGQRYVTVPVQPYARLKATGAPAYFIGSVTLHRTGVDGATAEQRAWRIKSVDIKPAP